MMYHRFTFLCLLVALIGLSPSAFGQPFIHPGGLHTLADLNRMKTNVLAGNHPWVDDWNVLITDSQASSNYSDHATANMGSSRQNADLDAHAAYLNFIEWYITGNTNYANRAVKICNDWSADVNVVPSGTDTPGLTTIPIAHFAEIGELLRLYPGWSATSFQAYTNMMLQYLYPSCNSFLTGHNGTCSSHYFANWDACNIEALIAMGVLCNNTNIYNQGVTYFESGVGNGAISNAVPYLYSGGLGQEQESGRDQEHATLGIGELGAACQTAWNQGLDLYGFAGNRLLAAAEYIGQYNLEHDVPYTSLNDCSGDNMFFVSNNGRGRLDDRPIWELFYNHYVVLCGLSAPNTTAMARLYRLEHGSTDHFGYGTLTFTLNATNSPYPPAPLPIAPTGLTAQNGLEQITLRWTPPPGDLAQGYNVLRATTSGGPYNVVATWNAANSPNTTPTYTDTSVVNGATYYYVVSANNQIGPSANSSEAGATAQAPVSVPPGWTSQDIGTVTSSGSGVYSSGGPNTFQVTGYGTGIGGTADGGFQYTFVSATNNFTMVARLTANGADQMGLMMRSSLATNAALVQIMMAANARQSTYGVRTPGGNLDHYNSGDQFAELPAWYMLTRSGNTFTAWQSDDGANWINVQSSTVSMGSTYYAGIAINSGSATFDNVFYTNAAVTGNFAPPAAPANLTATVNGPQVYLVWTPVANALDYNVKRATASAGPYTNIAASVSATAFYDTTAAAGTTYYYAVSAVNGGGESTNSAPPASVTTLAASAPPAPSSLTASAGTTQITVSWTASPGTTGYNVKRAINVSGPFTNIATAVPAIYADTNVVSGIVYYYFVTALNTNGESANSPSASASLAAKLTGAINGTTGSYNNDGNTIANVFDGNFNTFFDAPASTGGSNCWAGLDFGTGVSNLILQIKYCPRAGYESRMLGGMFQGANDSGFTNPIALFTVTTQPSDGVFTAQAIGVTNAFRYARYLSPVGGWGNVAEVEFDGLRAVLPPPVAPTSLTATAGNSRVFLNWAMSAGASGYNLKQSLANGGPYNTIISALTSTTYTNTGLTNGVIYYYVVAATNSTAESANSAPASAQPVSSAPVNLGLSASANLLQISWPTDHIGWVLQMQTNSNSAGLGTNWVTITNSNLTNLFLPSPGIGADTAFFRLMHP